MLPGLEQQVREALDRRSKQPHGARMELDALVGTQLLKVQGGLRRGEWLEWLDRFGMSRRVAQRMMKVAEIGRGAYRQTLPPKLRWDVWERDDFRCVYCGKRRYLETDHVIPICAGGTNDLWNIVTACYSCNRKKESADIKARNRQLIEAQGLTLRSLTA